MFISPVGPPRSFHWRLQLHSQNNSLTSLLPLHPKKGRIQEFWMGGWGRSKLWFGKECWTFFVANYFSPTFEFYSQGMHNRRPAEKTETTTCFSICERWSPLAREILLCEQRRKYHRRVPKKKYIFEYPWNLVWWQSARRTSLKKNQPGKKWSTIVWM